MCEQVVAKKRGSGCVETEYFCYHKIGKHHKYFLKSCFVYIYCRNGISTRSFPVFFFFFSVHSPKFFPGCHLPWKRSQGYRQLTLKVWARCNIINQGLNCLQKFDTVFTFTRYIFLSLFYCFLLSTSTTLKFIERRVFLATTNKVKSYLTMFWVA